MQYMGSKAKLAARILPVVLRGRNADQWYVEPFVGGANMIDKVTGPRLGNDAHPQLIAMWKALQEGWRPPTVITKQMYYWVKERQEVLPPALVGFVGFLCSFGGKWWGGYAFNAKGENYAERASKVLAKQIRSLVGVSFVSMDYRGLSLPSNSIVYCDPPYAGTTKYKDSFDHAAFWGWVRTASRAGHSVFVSEYGAPNDFDCLLEIEHKTTLDRNSQYPRVERLFRLRNDDAS